MGNYIKSPNVGHGELIGCKKYWIEWNEVSNES